jgi:hypothetical protein
VTDIPPFDLDATVAYLYPDALWVTYERHSDQAYTVNVLNLDYRYTVWLGSLSLDGRWTLSPREGPFQGSPVWLDWSL